ncbi:MAG: ATP-binding protein [Thomasclavelia sp.]|nr:ATP-binding protein [Thomasclavelia sp.]
MTKSIIKYFITVLLLALFVSSTVTVVILSDQQLQTTKRDMLSTVKLCDYSFDYTKDFSKQITKINKLAYEKDSRLTIIDLDGKVLADSSKQDIEDNHSNREEVKQALNQKVGYSTRYSTTVRKNLLYVAYNNGNYILRISIPYNGIFDNITILLEPLVISSLIALLIAISLSYKFSKTITKPINDINNQINKIKGYEELEFPVYKYDEFNTIAYRLKNQSEIIKKTMTDLRKEKIKINGILNQMNEGFILLDKNMDVLIYNELIKSLYPNIEEKKDIRDFVFDFKIIDALNSLNDSLTTVDINKDHIIYRAFISKVDYGITILYVDVTSEVNSNKVRQEFFSNVSHELKTPLTSIKGYCELLQTDVIKDKDEVKSALMKVEKEVNSMASLINDILMISRLENKDVEAIKTIIHFEPIVNEIIDTLTPSIKQKNITITKNITSNTYKANYQHIQQLLSNLLSNAVKYNKENGTINIDIKDNDANINIIVSDSGIGISLIDQTRIFERFYRVNKGRDKSISGTGLGLAIVKHIVMYYGGTIDVESKLDEGTTFNIVLPK